MVRTEREGDVVIWTIDRPSAKNALDEATMRELRRAVDEVREERAIRAVVLTGAGDAFVSGGDLRELRERSTAEHAAALTDVGWDLLGAIEALPVPVIGAINGHAIGGGAELALACDMRVAEARAVLSFKQVRLGVTTAWGGAARLVTLVGAGPAARLLFSARDVTAAEAQSLGLVDEVVADGASRATAVAWAREIAKGSPDAVAAMKRLVREALAEPARSVRALERDLFVSTWSGADHAEAVEAFFGRRAPRWGERG